MVLRSSPVNWLGMKNSVVFSLQVGTMNARVAEALLFAVEASLMWSGFCNKA